MGKTPDRIRTQGAVILAIDVHQYSDKRGWHWTVDLHRPGTDGLYSKTWDAPGALPADRAADLCTWVANSVSNALVTWGGIREVLDADA